MEAKDRIASMLEELLPVCESWIQEKDGKLYFIDPNDNEEISAHYGATHMAAALILFGKMKGAEVIYQKGLNLLDSILSRWSYNKNLPEFHFDFNNFALCVIADAIKESEPSFYQRIQETVLQTGDSNHDTTNWLPMRWFVNLKRYEWDGDNKYNRKCKSFRAGIKKATNTDGGIEDRMPHGISFNLQYDVATVGVIQFLRVRGVDYDLAKELGFLLNAVAPDGDINYQGRGCNQIFAWSLWVYLLASSGRDSDLCKAMDFLEPKLLKMYQNHNLMLNDFDGSEKYLWWDYHYCSVYCAHFLLWLVIALLDYGRKSINECGCISHETGLKVLRYENAFVATFDGRREYLAEYGPIVCAIWTKGHGMINKGTFGPWRGMFGNKYSNEGVLYNYIGVINERTPPKKEKESILIKYLSKIPFLLPLLPKPKLCRFNIDLNGVIRITFMQETITSGVFNFPVIRESLNNADFKLFVDEREVDLIKVDTIKNQYGLLDLYQSKLLSGNVWSIVINTF